MASAPLRQAGSSSAALPTLAAISIRTPSRVCAGRRNASACCCRRLAAGLRFQAVIALQRRAWTGYGQPAPAVDDQLLVLVDPRQQSRCNGDGGQGERAGQDGYMRGEADIAEDQAAQATAVQAQQPGGGEGVGKEYGRPGKGGQSNVRRAAINELAQAGGDFADVAGALAQIGAGRTLQLGGQDGSDAGDGRAHRQFPRGDQAADRCHGTWDRRGWPVGP